MADSHNAGTDEELSRLRERLAYYESFDQLIQKSVADAGEILREAVEMREQAARETSTAATRTIEQRERQIAAFRALYSEMLDDITALQGQAERLARRLSDAIDALEAELQPEIAFPALADSLTVEIAATIEDVPDPLDPPDSPPVLPPLAEIAVSEEPETESAPVPSTEAREETSEPTLSPEMADRFVLLVHGVANAAAALSLKSYLEQLDAVSRVEPREFAAGLLRLQLNVSRGLRAEDLAGWSKTGTMTTVHARPGLLEISLSQAIESR